MFEVIKSIDDFLQGKTLTSTQSNFILDWKYSRSATEICIQSQSFGWIKTWTVGTYVGLDATPWYTDKSLMQNHYGRPQAFDTFHLQCGMKDLEEHTRKYWCEHFKEIWVRSTVSSNAGLQWLPTNNEATPWWSILFLPRIPFCFEPPSIHDLKYSGCTDFSPCSFPPHGMTHFRWWICMVRFASANVYASEVGAGMDETHHHDHAQSVHCYTTMS